MQKVFVLNKNKQPLMPCSSRRARELLNQGKAGVIKCHPFAILLKEREKGDSQEIELKLDPGSKISGVALVRHFQKGKIIHASLTKRSALRRSRRNRKEEWIAPSLQSRVDNIITWGTRLKKLAPLSSIAVETVSFDTQKIQDPEITGVEYQQGELLGFEINQLDKYGFPRTSAKQQRSVYGFKTGNLVKANVAQGKKKGRYFGRVAVRSSGNFCIDTTSGKVDGINYKYCKTIQSADGYNYSTRKTKKKEQHFLSAPKGEVSMLSRG